MSRSAALGTMTAGVALLAAAPTPAAAVATLAAPTTAADPLAPLLSLFALTAWALVAWLVAVALAATAGQLPGLPGRAAACIAGAIAPVGVRRLIEVSLGLTVAAGVLGAAPASAGTHLPPVPPPAVTSLDWPVSRADGVPTRASSPAPTDEPVTAAPSLDWNPSAVDRARASSAPAIGRSAVVVQPGDSLWAVAADHLPAGATDAQIAQSWPSWWSVNRAAVGPDPDLIHPGLSLTPPAPPSPTE